MTDKDIKKVLITFIQLHRGTEMRRVEAEKLLEWLDEYECVKKEDLARLFEGYDNWTKQYPNSANQKWLKAIKEAGT